MSKRIIKNIVMIILIIVLCIAMFFSVNPKNMENDFNRDGMKFREGYIPEGIPQENGKMPEIPGEDATQQEMAIRKGQGKMRPNIKDTPMNTTRTILCIVEGSGISSIVVYLIFSKFNKLTIKETFENKSKIISFIVLVVLTTSVITMLVMLITKNNKANFNSIRDGMMPMMEEETEKSTKAEDVDSGKNVDSEIINLSEHTSNITITKAGSYTLTGEFGYTVLVDADGEVILNLNNATIKNEITAALANISTNPLTINLLEGTNNTFSDGGSSEYDSCVFSSGPLTFKGNGNLEVYGNQDDGEGIATETNNLTIDGGNIKIISNDDGLNAGGDGGTIKINNGTITIKASGDGIDSNKNIVINGGNVYTIGSSKGGDAGVDADEGTTINGGTLIALGSDMLEKPLNDSKQNVIVSNLNTTIESGSELVLKDLNGNEILSFTAEDSFKTIIISDSKIEKGKYNLYKKTELIAELECK